MDLNRLRLITIIVPLAFILVVEFLADFVLSSFIPNGGARLVFQYAVFIIAAVPFAIWVFDVISRQHRDLAQVNEELGARVAELRRASRQIERRHQQLAVASDAISLISTDLEPEKVLQQIVDSARDVVRARYAALGVSDASGRIVKFITSGLTAAEREAIGPLPEGHGLLGALIEDKRPLRVSNIGEDPRSVGFPANHPPMRTLLGVPILYQGRPIGDLYTTDKAEAEDFTDEDEEILMLLAGHAAVAITNARLYEEVAGSRDQLQVLNRGLEAKVAERTRQIQEQTRELTKRVLQAQEDERKRIARELHDETAQALSTLLINIDLLELQLPPADLSLQPGLERLRTLAKRTLDETRALSHDLRPTILDDVGLVAAIQWFADEWTQSFDVPVEVEAAGDPPRLPPETEVALFRIAQEALNNAGKYSQASRIRVSMEFPDGSARLMVEDDGRGFDPSAVPAPSREGGLGLYGMHERAELIGGALSIVSRPGHGTRVTVTAPTRLAGQATEGAEEDQART